MLYQTLNPHGGDLYSCPVIVDFSANTNPLGTPEAVKQAVRDSIQFLNQYPDPYCRELVKAIAQFEQVSEEFVLCGCGAAELIFSYCTAIKAKHALELAPTFLEYSTALEASGCCVERWRLSQQNDFTVDEAFLYELEKGSWDVVFLCNPNNPTGRIIDEGLLYRIADICQRKGMRLFLDECFLDLTDDGRQQSLKEHLNRWPSLFILKAFTKSYGMAGLRLGYCLSSDKELLMAMGRSVQPWNISIPAQVAGVAALGEIEFIEHARQIIRTERKWLEEQLASLDIQVCPSCANYLLIYSKLPLQEKLIEQGIMIRNCSNYHGLEEGWYRIAVKRHEENQLLITALRKIMEEC